ncbi:MAG TPA: alkaline phosphatase PafA [Chitinophagaceae bacterium]|nr:alkaline phosphatase PafA [Chitinophagaceae bacterium]
MIRTLLVFCVAIISNCIFAQPARPKLVVGIMVDQMRWDFLYRYYDRFSPQGGFKRMLGEGFSCEQAMIDYTPTVTGVGHTCVYTGTVPSISGITGNAWWDRKAMRSVYCVEDQAVSTVGSSSTNGRMSPRNLVVTTIGDELRLATNFRSKVIGIGMKDRGSILPAGHNGTAYWYDNTTGNWITSTYYMAALPKWVADFNAQKWPNKFYREGWKLVYPIDSYRQSSADVKAFEEKKFGQSFPYDLSRFENRDYAAIATTPHGNSLTTQFARAAILGEKLGADEFTDLLALSYSPPDHIGHAFGPNSVEVEDTYIRLDRELGELFNFLDARVGRGHYSVFLSADHGVAEIPEFLQENKIPAGRVFMGSIVESMNRSLAEKFGLHKLILSNSNYQLSLDVRAIDSAGIDRRTITNRIVEQLAGQPGIARAFPLAELNTVPLPSLLRERLNNSYYPGRSGDIQLILQSHYIDAYNNTGTTHGLWNPYDSHIPLLWYGWGIRKGKSQRTVNMSDIAPTLAALLHVQLPSGCVGQPIPEVLK